jgi:hypothetical protein
MITTHHYRHVSVRFIDNGGCHSYSLSIADQIRYIAEVLEISVRNTIIMEVDDDAERIF